MSGSVRTGVLVGRPADTAGLCVGVLMGGTSSEREVSLASGREIVKALGEAPSAGDRRGPRRAFGVEIDAGGAWLVGGERLAPPAALERLAEVDVYFLALHGGAGEDGTLQGLLESAGRTFTGSGVCASAVCMDKLATRGVAREIGAEVAPGLRIARREWSAERGDLLRRARALSSAGWVVKPRFGGSSVGVFAARDGGELESAIERSLGEEGGEVLVEELVAGVEVSCGVLGNHGGPCRALTPVEIRPRTAAFFDYREKYSEDGAEELCPPPSLDAGGVARVRACAEAMHRAAGCRGSSRTDFIARRGADGAWIPVFLETNTLPGLTPRSLLPRMAAAEGLDFRSLCLWILASALEGRPEGGREEPRR